MLDLLGKFLVARPTMRDARFREAVILVVEHSKSHSMGLVINKPVGKPTMADLRKDFKITEAKHQPQPNIFYGGPVGLQKLIVLHTPDWSVPKQTFQFNTEMWASNSSDVIHATLGNQKKGPSKWIICLGQCQWSAGQLEAEIMATNGRLKTDAWLPAELDANTVFSMKPPNRWRKTLSRIAQTQFNRVFNHAVETQ